MQQTKSRHYPDGFTVSYEKYFIMRAEKGLSEADVAKLAGITPSMLSRWRRGISVPTPKTLHKIAKVFHCNVTDFFGKLPDAI